MFKKNSLMKKLSIGVASLALVAPLALGGMNNVNADATQNDNDGNLVILGSKKAQSNNNATAKKSVKHAMKRHHAKKHSKKSLKKYAKDATKKAKRDKRSRRNKKTRKMTFKQMIRYYEQQDAKADRARMNKPMKLQKPVTPPKATRKQKAEYKELTAISNQASSIKKQLRHYNSKVNKKAPRKHMTKRQKRNFNNSKKATVKKINALKKQLNKVEQTANTLKVTQLPTTAY